MRRWIGWCLVSVMLAGCVSTESAPLLIVTASPLPSPTLTATPVRVASLVPTPLPSYPPIGITKISPANTVIPTPAFPWLEQAELLFQPGDLPETYSLNDFSKTLPAWLGEKFPLPPDSAATITIRFQTNLHAESSVSLYYYRDLSNLIQAFRIMVDIRNYQRQGIPQPGIGETAILFPTEEFYTPAILLFRDCHSIVQISLRDVTDLAVLTRYANRLAERVEAVDCQGQAGVPLQTPPSPLPTPTAASPIPITLGFPASVQRLVDPYGAITIRAFAFPDEQHGWLALGNQILATSDGGSSWQEQTVTNSMVEGITFFDNEVGWIELNQGYLVTRDGGKGWQEADSPPPDPQPKMAPPPTSPGPDEHDPRGVYGFCNMNRGAVFAGGFFSIDPQTGWAFCTGPAEAHFGGTQLFQTQDGGQHWQMISAKIPYGPWHVPSFFFLDKQQGWMAGDLGVFISQDGGKSWQLLPPVTVDHFPIHSSELGGIHFLSPQTGFAIFHQTDANAGRDALLKTLDGGTTWQIVYPAPEPPLFPEGSFQMFPDGRGIGISGEDILSTTDAGKTWSLVSRARLPKCPPGDKRPRISFPDPLHGWMVADCVLVPAPRVFSTQDGGKTWQEHTLTGIRIDDVIVGVSFPTMQTGYLVTQAGDLFRTEDGGNSFERADPLSAHTPSLQFATPGVGWETRGTNLFQSVDGGKSWQPIAFPLLVRFFTLRPDGQGWIAAGETYSEDGTRADLRLFYTKDGGSTWTEHAFGGFQPSGSPSSLDTIQFADAEHGWLRVDSAFFTTTDGGHHWVQYH